MPTKKKPAGSQPTQLALLPHMTYSPAVTPRREVTQVVDVTRQDETGKDVLVQTKFTIRMPDEKETLPMIHHRQVLDAFIRDLVRLGVPDDDTIPFRPSTTLRDLGLSDGGENYRTVYDAIQKYYQMEVSFSDTAETPRKRKGALPYLTGVRIVSAFQVPKPDRDGHADGNNGWIRFERWFTDGLRDKNNRKYLSLAILSSFKIGETRRIYEVVKKFMGNKPVFEIGITKLSKWIPYDKDLDTRLHVQKTKRAIEQLLETGAFPKIEMRGRGKDTIVKFYNVESGVIEESEEPKLRIKPGAEPAILDHSEPAGPVSRILSELRQLMSQEARQDGRTTSAAFIKELGETEAVYVAVLDKWQPTLEVLHEAIAETKSALKEGRIKSTVRQFFVDTLGRYSGAK
jgi:hypothetical protein